VKAQLTKRGPITEDTNTGFTWMIPEAGTGGNMFYSSLSEVGNEHNIYLFIERRNQKSTLPSRKLEAQSRKINPPQYKFHHVPCAC